MLFLSSMTHFGGDLSNLSDVPYCRQPPWNSFQVICAMVMNDYIERLVWRCCSCHHCHSRCCSCSKAARPHGCLHGIALDTRAACHACQQSLEPPVGWLQAYCNSKLCTLLAAKHMDRLLAR